MSKKNGPGQFYRKGLSWPQLMKMFPDDAAAEQWFAAVRWPASPQCPHCESKNVQSGAAHKSMHYRCRACRKRFSVRTKTVMADTKLGYLVWLLAIYALTTGIKGTSSMKLHRDLGITQKNAWHLAHRIRVAWQAEQHLLAGPVEADEVYIGGREANKHAHKKLRAGRGTVGKTPVAGEKDRGTNEVQVVDKVNRVEMQSFVEDHVDPDAMLYTDESSAYDTVSNRRAVVRHGIGEYVNEQAHVNGMESFWALMRRGFYGTYHKMSDKHLTRYIGEFAGRHNARASDTLEQMALMAHGMLGKRLTYQELIAA